jgi:hypothetical protein
MARPAKRQCDVGRQCGSLLSLHLGSQAVELRLGLLDGDLEVASSCGRQLLQAGGVGDR